MSCPDSTTSDAQWCFTRGWFRRQVPASRPPFTYLQSSTALIGVCPSFTKHILVRSEQYVEQDTRGRGASYTKPTPCGLAVFRQFGRSGLNCRSAECFGSSSVLHFRKTQLFLSIFLEVGGWTVGDVRLASSLSNQPTCYRSASSGMFKDVLCVRTYGTYVYVFARLRTDETTDKRPNTVALQFSSSSCYVLTHNSSSRRLRVTTLPLLFCSSTTKDAPSHPLILCRC